MRIIPTLILLAVMASCSWISPPPAEPQNLADRIGLANVTIASIADTVRLACGNTEPGGPCLSTALVNRSDVDMIKMRLTEAGALLDAAQINGGDDALANLAAAQRVIAEVKQLLLTREVDVK